MGRTATKKKTSMEMRMTRKTWRAVRTKKTRMILAATKGVMKMMMRRLGLESMRRMNMTKKRTNRRAWAV
jgi:hypothetical protein